jgi:hypothetical protein
MNEVVFIYKRNKDLVFLDTSNPKHEHDELIADDYQHIATVSATRAFSVIYKIIQSKKTATDKVKAIRKYLRYENT